MTVKELSERLCWTLFCGDGEKRAEGCYIGDLLSRVMGNCAEGDVWITVQTSQNMAAVALLSEAACVLLPEGIVPPEDTRERARAEGITIAGSGKSAYQLACDLQEALQNQ